MKKLLKTASFTDIHFGAHKNSTEHNQDCLNFITWFCDIVTSDREIDNIIFLGDYNENRAAINISTMKFAYEGAKMINKLGLPVFFIVGNHDLYHRHTREVHSIIPYTEFSNFTVVDHPTVVEHLGPKGALICPYMFPDEYPSLKKYLNLSTWWGHFEFKGFEVTGYGMRMPTGPEANDYVGPNHIFSGHFHKRQAHEHICYIGNTFPTNYGDAGDNDRGCMVYNHIDNDAVFHNWEQCPKYVKTTLSDMLDDKTKIYDQARVKCIVDIEISYEESMQLKQKFQEQYNLRELIMEESADLNHLLSNTKTGVDSSDIEIKSVDELVLQMLSDIDSEKIDNNILVDIYKGLKK